MPINPNSMSNTQELRIEQIVAVSVRQRLDNCAYRLNLNKVSWQFHLRRLTLSGSVPSFYLKQVLQESLRNIEHIDLIVNDVFVTSSPAQAPDHGHDRESSV